MTNQFSRTEMLLGNAAIERLRQSAVAVFGIGGVGSYAAEALARGGVGTLCLVDNDRIRHSNINRQLIALHSTVGREKTDVMRERILDIDPQVKVTARSIFFSEETAAEFDFGAFSYIIDAIDTVSGKLSLIQNAKRARVPVISCMGAGNKLNPTRFEVADIYETSVCPLARVMRRELRRLGIRGLKVVYSKEPPLRPRRAPDCFGAEDDENGKNPSRREEFVSHDGGSAYHGGDLVSHGGGSAYHGGDSLTDGKGFANRGDQPARRQVPGSVAFVPPVAGLILAGEVIMDLIKEDAVLFS